MLQVEEMEEQVKKNYHRLFAALMVRIGSSVGVEPLKPTVVSYYWNCIGSMCNLSVYW